jgi:hypothetical protein
MCTRDDYEPPRDRRPPNGAGLQMRVGIIVRREKQRDCARLLYGSYEPKPEVDDFRRVVVPALSSARIFFRKRKAIGRESRMIFRTL